MSEAAAPTAAAVGGGPPRRWARGLTRFRPKTLTQWLGLVLVLGWVLVALLAPVIAPSDPAQPFIHLQAPSGRHLFGTDQLGRDVLSRVIYGARSTLPVGVAIVALAMVIGVPIGALAGFAGGWIGEVCMRIADIFLAFPTIILALAVAAALGPNVSTAVIAIAVAFWPRYARLVRGEALSIKNRDYVMASRSLGARPRQLLFRTVLPNSLPAVLQVAILDIGSATLVGATLSFLGLGIAPPTPEWGKMVSESVQYAQDWWMGVFPGLALITFVIGINMYGEIIEDTTGRGGA